MKTLDNIDKKILRLLQKDARLNTKEIADKIGLSVTPTYERLKKIEKKWWNVITWPEYTIT